jgi:hypothetical protein
MTTTNPPKAHLELWKKNVLSLNLGEGLLYGMGIVARGMEHKKI